MIAAEFMVVLSSFVAWTQTFDEFKILAAQSFCDNISKFDNFVKTNRFERTVLRPDVLLWNFHWAVGSCQNYSYLQDGGESQEAGVIAVQTFINCKFCDILSTLIETVELIMEDILKTITENRWTRKSKIDTANTASMSQVTNILEAYRDNLTSMYSVLSTFESRYPVSRDQGYVTEAVNRMYLYVNRRQTPPIEFDAEVDDKIRRVRYVHLQILELVDRYDQYNCAVVERSPLWYNNASYRRSDRLKSFIDLNNSQDRAFLSTCLYLVGVPQSTGYRWEISGAEMAALDNVKCIWDGNRKSIKDIQADVMYDYRPMSVFKFNELANDIVLATFYFYLRYYIDVYLTWFYSRKLSAFSRITKYDHPDYSRNKVVQWIDYMFMLVPKADTPLSDIHARLTVPDQVAQPMDLEALLLVVSTRVDVYIDVIDLNTVRLNDFEHSGSEFYEVLDSIERDMEKLFVYVKSVRDRPTEHIIL